MRGRRRVSSHVLRVAWLAICTVLLGFSLMVTVRSCGSGGVLAFADTNLLQFIWQAHESIFMSLLACATILYIAHVVLCLLVGSGLLCSRPEVRLLLGITAVAHLVSAFAVGWLFQIGLSPGTASAVAASFVASAGAARALDRRIKRDT